MRGGGGQRKARVEGANDGKAISGLTTYAACTDIVDVVTLVGVLYVLGADRGDCQRGKKDSGTEAHGE
jgi:hypothetical protein